MARVVVVGTGIAGLIAAYRASAEHDVVLVTKADLGESNTKYAQGGIAAALFPDDSAEAHAADTVRAGDGLCDPATVDVLCTEGPGRVRDLIALGVEFDRINGELERGHEAAHSARRVIHAGGDATGLAIETALVAAVRTLALEVHEHTFMRDLVIDDSGPDRRVSGIEVVDTAGVVRVIDADIVILASGGAGQLYTHTTNPLVATGDGTAAALRAGVVLADLEFYQFHPTALAVAGTPLISEAVRGEGAVLLDEHGRRFMFDVHPDGELAPRDVVARGIANAMAAQGGRPVLLDATALGRDYLEQRFPGIDRSCAAHGFDWATTPIPVTPAAHYWMGGIRTDAHGRTSLRGLFAVGEVACTGVHGANRLASNSLLESLAFAWRATDVLTDAWPQFASTATTLGAAAAGDVPVDRAQVQRLMWDLVGIERSAAGLRAAAAQLEEWTVVGDSVSDLETRNLLDLARLTVTAALCREESRGAHWRTDFPESSALFAQSFDCVVPASLRVKEEATL
ncbi:L-aspartate oxidase [Salinibacterium sp. G-O1]|uniref:L-aspartate oxidase n=1 Tax=Salinibacterium sp. G-O1 TaxID=3046208 RepID=UPI0024BAF709|nr:L-aspartate oxidase [Salinibacterium sp. G-O1]MDJ0335406.1 L-aspartate oxidase [Salinibacterium sp. G-O1]